MKNTQQTSYHEKLSCIRKLINDGIFAAAKYLEMLLSCIIIVVILISVLKMLFEMDSIIQGVFSDASSFTEFLGVALNFVVGIEFVKMLCKYTPETVIEVLMLATARQMVVEHLETWQTLIGIASITLLFIIRKYLFTPISHAGNEPLYAEDAKIHIKETTPNE